MTSFLFIIPNKKLKIYFAFAIGIIVLNILGLVAYITSTTRQTSNVWFLITLMLAALVVLFYILSLKKRLEFAGTLILLSGIFWISRGFNELFFANLLLWLLYSVSRRRLLVSVDMEAVTYPSFPKKRISWDDINNVILKDDILTIDLKNNKIYQHFIEYVDNTVNEQEFNEFCKQQVMNGK